MKFISTLLLVFFTPLFSLDFAKVYQKDIDTTGWFMSEKLDGIRGYWDGERLLSKAGNDLNAPKFFTKNFPPFELDGELWTKRGDFENILSIVKSGKNWEKLTYNIFEVPNANGNFSTRLNKIENYLKINQTEYIRVIEQIECKNLRHLERVFNNLISKGAEGVMVKNPNAEYQNGRSDNLLKLKPYFDAEAKVIGYREGNGKFKGQLGSILVEFQNKKLYIGSGFSQKERENPPKIGEIITFKYSGFTKNQIPRFPVFLRVRGDINLSE